MLSATNSRQEHILVCLSSSPSNARIILTAARMAAAFQGHLTALYVETPDSSAMTEEDRNRLSANTRLAKKLGANVETVQGDNVPYQIAEFARLWGATKIVLGRSAAGKQRFFRKTTLVDRLIAIAPNIDIHIIPDSTSNHKYHQQKTKNKLPAFSVREAAKCALILLAASLINMVFYSLGLTDPSIIMVYILGVLVTAIVTDHQIYSIVSSVLSVILFNFIFTEPRFSLHAFDAGYPITFAVMFLAAYITGSLAIRLKNNAHQSAQAAYRTRILLDTDQLLNRAESHNEIISILAGQLIKLLNRDIVIYPIESGSLSEAMPFPADEHNTESIVLTDKDRSIAEWVAQNNRCAGATTDMFSDSSCLYLAICINRRVYGVVGITMNSGKLDSFESSVLLSMLSEGALALENEKNAREKEAASLLAKNEQLRANLLRAISHDLRTPLTSISGNASILLSEGSSFDESTRHQLYTNIHNESIWLINLVENLLYVTRIEDGRMNLNPSVELIDEIIDEALGHINRRGRECTIVVKKEKDYTLVRADARLIVQVLINLIDNALKYTPQNSDIHISVREQNKLVHVSVQDNGPGIPDSEKEKIFEMFYTGVSHTADSNRSLGLGLSLCRSIINAHGGTITVVDNKPTGSIFEFTLPSEEVSIHE